MELNQLFEKLSGLNIMETLGKKYYQKYGKRLNYSQYLLLTRYAKGDFPPLEVINSPAFEEESQKVRKQFIAQYRQEGLSEQDFIQPDCDIEIEKLYRFVDIPSHAHNFLELVFVLNL